MCLELISTVSLTADNRLIITLKSGGKPSYEYIYREAAGVHWYNEISSFSSTELKEWTIDKWFKHILTITSRIGVSLKLADDTQWNELMKDDIDKIKNACRY
jgi:hypothetical protein